MVTIPAVLDENGVQFPSKPFPPDVTAVVCDGSIYTVYEPGDAVPAI